MNTCKDKKVVVGADGAGFSLKEAVVAYLEKKGWEVLDLGVKKDSVPNDPDNMFHRVGFRVGAKISEGEYEKGLVFCGTGMGIHIAAGKCPHVHCGVVESVPAGLRAACGNGANVLSISDAASSGVDMGMPVLAAGVASAAIAGALSIWIIKRISRCKKLYFFGIYCIVVGIIAAVL